MNEQLLIFPGIESFKCFKRLRIMPTKPKSPKTPSKTPKSPKASSKHKEHEEMIDMGTIHEEIEAPIASEIVFRKIWRIKKFHKTIAKKDLLDSPVFRCSVNGMTTFWNIAVRFWKGPNGKKVTNPLVICLNLTGCETEETGQARVRFQFGVWDASIRHWECCQISSVVLNLENKSDLISVGYRSLGIVDRHIDHSSKDVQIMVKIQIIQSDEEVHSLSQDMARLMSKEDAKDVFVKCTCGENDSPITAHSWIIKCRSGKLGKRLVEHEHEKNKNIKFMLDFTDYPHGLVSEFIRYIYTDKVDNAEKYAHKLLPLSMKLQLPGLTALCERTLIESLTPCTVPNILLLADQYGCENLRKAALHYCENSEEIRESVHLEGKSLAWRVMEMVNPNLFQEACESIGSSSSNLDSPGTTGSWSD